VRDFLKEHHVEEKFTHSLGHGIGLKVHESPRIRSDSSSEYHLETGVVMTIEPGLYVPGLGGIRLEDTVVVHIEGAPSLTPSPFDLICHESQLSRNTHV
jgi:Xaa-Pro aminopeptidase